MKTVRKPTRPLFGLKYCRNPTNDSKQVLTYSYLPLDFQLKKLRAEALAVLMDSELVAPYRPDEVCLSNPGAMQYLQSLAHLATSITMESSALWGTQQAEGQLKGLLGCLLRCSHYEVRQLALERLLERLQTNQKHQALPFDLSVSTLAYMAVHEPHPTCLAKVRGCS